MRSTGAVIDAPEILHRDLLPVDVSMGERVIAIRARAFVTSRRLLVYAADPIRLVFEVDLERAPERNLGTMQGALDVYTVDGLVWLNRSHGCACGSYLRAIDAPVPW